MNKNFQGPFTDFNNIGSLSVAWWASYSLRQCGACAVRLEDDSRRCAALPGRPPGENRRCEQRGLSCSPRSAYPSAGPGKTSERANLSVREVRLPVIMVDTCFL